MLIYRKSIFIVASLVFCLSSLTGQSDTTSIPFVAYWNKGDSYNFRITKVRQQWSQDLLTRNDSSSYLVNFQVIDSTSEDYKISWRYETNLTDFSIPNELIKKLPANQVTEIIYTTDQLGQFVGVENWKEISKKMKKLFSALTELQATEKTIKNDTIKQILAGISEILATKEGIEQLLLKEIQIFHFPFGFELNSSEPLLYEEVYPNLLGGDALKGDGKIYVDSVDYLNSYCSLRQEVTMRPGETKAFLLSFFRKMVSSDAELVEALKNSAYDITDKNRFAYWYFPGIPHQVESIRHMLMDIMDNKFKRRDVLRIEIQE